MNKSIYPFVKTLIISAKKQCSLIATSVGIIAALGGFLYGYETGLSNSVLAMTYVKENFAKNHESFSARESALTTATLSLGTLFGALSSSVLADSIGRRSTIILATLLIFNIGTVIQLVATNVPILCVGRTVTGFGLGIISAVVPLYQSEVSSKYVRGSIVSLYQWAITWGFLASSGVAQGTHSRNDSGSYRIPIGLQSLWAILLSIGMYYLPESPRYYVKKGKIVEAAMSLSTLRKLSAEDYEIIEELVEIKANHDYEDSIQINSFLQIFKSGRGHSKQFLRIMTGICLQALQQATGINFVFYYGVNFFINSGVQNSYIISFVTYAVNVVATVPGIFMVETIGRRKCLIYGALLMSIFNLIIAIVGVTTNSVIANKIMIAFVCCFIATFASTWGPVVWVYVSEIYSLNVRAKGVSIAAGTNWLFNFAFAFVTPYLLDQGNHTAALGTSIFFIWGGLTLAGAVFSYFAIYETKGLKLEEIDEIKKIRI
ncbi:general substrate transporter [Ascoidea rubescens DSM 1968]|uniref:General substrate transporter n=1 Tax=Ascoidea rubescens DSM 1968 TaxID=1344418 RepID=A0A1D2V8X2_9ASCO|nr:general substrate transporter [Ascoidea rubescens DSM 1968]ODV58090.1 general substrate transporter [Ascoidea rubescens DSM 1968]